MMLTWGRGGGRECLGRKETRVGWGKLWLNLTRVKGQRQEEPLTAMQM